MADFGHAGAKGRQPVLLARCGAQHALHVRQFALGDADFVAAVRGCNNQADIFRIVAKRGHACGNTPHRPHQQPLQR
jgi:hypothetical protein